MEFKVQVTLLEANREMPVPEEILERVRDGFLSRLQDGHPQQSTSPAGEEVPVWSAGDPRPVDLTFLEDVETREFDETLDPGFDQESAAASVFDAIAELTSDNLQPEPEALEPGDSLFAGFGSDSDEVPEPEPEAEESIFSFKDDQPAEDYQEQEELPEEQEELPEEQEELPEEQEELPEEPEELPEEQEKLPEYLSGYEADPVLTEEEPAPEQLEQASFEAAPEEESLLSEEAPEAAAPTSPEQDQEPQDSDDDSGESDDEDQVGASQDGSGSPDDMDKTKKKRSRGGKKRKKKKSE